MHNDRQSRQHKNYFASPNTAVLTSF
jgi:hypothetical protein